MHAQQTCAAVCETDKQQWPAVQRGSYTHCPVITCKKKDLKKNIHMYICV